MIRVDVRTVGFAMLSVWLFGCDTAVAAAPAIPAVSVVTSADGSQTYSLSIQILGLMTALTFLPAAVLMMSSFTRIIIVLAILRQALGTMSTPSNQVLLGLALFLSLFVMTPVIEAVNVDAVQPYLNESLTLSEALAKAQDPVRTFMLAHTREPDLRLFAEISNRGPFASLEAVPFTLLVPAFVTSELRTAFEIGFLVFVPFLVIDLVVASILMGMGMVMLSPLVISFPFKIMLFVLVDGWALLLGTLASSFLVN